MARPERLRAGSRLGLLVSKNRQDVLVSFHMGKLAALGQYILSGSLLPKPPVQVDQTESQVHVAGLVLNSFREVRNRLLEVPCI